MSPRRVRTLDYNIGKVPCSNDGITAWTIHPIKPFATERCHKLSPISVDALTFWLERPKGSDLTARPGDWKERAS